MEPLTPVLDNENPLLKIKTDIDESDKVLKKGTFPCGYNFNGVREYCWRRSFRYFR